MDPATRLALDVNWRNLALGHTTFQAEGATFVVNRSFPAIYDANFIYGAAAATDVAVDRLLARARVAYAHAEAITFRIGPDAPDALTRRLGASGRGRAANRAARPPASRPFPTSAIRHG